MAQLIISSYPLPLSMLSPGGIDHNSFDDESVVDMNISDRCGYVVLDAVRHGSHWSESPQNGLGDE